MTDTIYQFDRSPDARRRAETALVRLAHAHEAEPPRLVLLGGLVPALLAGPTAPAHLGTTDVDLLVVLHVAEPTDSSPLERALERAGFEPDPKSDGWRWRALVDRVGVKVEFLCDDETIRDSDGRRCAVVPLAGCRTLTAANLDGTRFVAFDTRTRTITAPLVDGTEATVDITSPVDSPNSPTRVRPSRRSPTTDRVRARQDPLRTQLLRKSRPKRLED